MEFVHLGNARTKEQEAVMQKSIADGVCPFCSENVSKYHKKPIYAEGTYWLLTENQWPYDGAKNHLLAITKEHVESLQDLDPQAGTELFELFQKEMKERGIDGGTMALRFGSHPKYANTVKHLHAHLIDPDVEDPAHPGIKFTVSKAAK
jgi:diadenosine tetraphosphate (Ap4A) HIT family hydrolase